MLGLILHVLPYARYVNLPASNWWYPFSMWEYQHRITLMCALMWWTHSWTDDAVLLFSYMNTAEASSAGHRPPKSPWRSLAHDKTMFQNVVLKFLIMLIVLTLIAHILKYNMYFLIILLNDLACFQPVQHVTAQWSVNRQAIRCYI